MPCGSCGRFFVDCFVGKPPPSRKDLSDTILVPGRVIPPVARSAATKQSANDHDKQHFDYQKLVVKGVTLVYISNGQ